MLELVAFFYALGEKCGLGLFRHCVSRNSGIAVTRHMRVASIIFVMFVGRDNELATLEQWVADDSSRSGILVGSAGSGKSELLKAFERRYTGPDTAKGHWYVQRSEITDSQQPGEAMDGLLRDMYSAYNGYVKTGPDDRERLRALLQTIPSIGRLLATFVEQDTRAGWQRFRDFVGELSQAALHKHGDDTRLIFLIDPRNELQLGNPGDWIPLAEDLPDAVRLIIAQRPDDTLATHREALNCFDSVLDSPLGDLPELEIKQWYEQEIQEGQISDFDASLHETIWRAACERYAGFPLAHDAVIKVLAQDKPAASALQDAINCMPRKVTGLLDLLYEKLCTLGDEQYRAALTLCVFGMPTPQAVWAQASNIDPVAFARMLTDARFSCLFRTVQTRFGECYLPYHPLFTERLECELADDAVRNDISEAAWIAISPRLGNGALKNCNAPFFELAAAVPVAARSGKTERLLDITNATFAPKYRFGLLDEAASDMRLMLERLGENKQVNIAVVYSNLGNVMQIRGAVNDAENVYRKALKINEGLGDREGMARDYGNLGSIMQARGDLDSAKDMYNEALVINKQLGRREREANNYGSLGSVMRRRGHLNEAEKLCLKALAINEETGWQEGIASAAGNLGNVMQASGKLGGAEAMYLKALATNEELGQRAGMADDYGNLGNIRQLRGDLDGAVEMYHQSLAINNELGRLEGIANDYVNLGFVMQTRGDMDNAEKKYRHALAINKQLGRREGMASAYGNLANVSQLRGDLEEAEKLYRQSLAINEKLGRFQGIATDYANLGFVMRTRGDMDRARALWLRSCDLFAKLGEGQMTKRIQAWIADLPSP